MAETNPQIIKLALLPISKPRVEKLTKLLVLAESALSYKSFTINGNLNLVLLLQFTAAAKRLTESALAQINGNSFYGTDFMLRPLVEAFINYKYIIEDSTQQRARAFMAEDLKSRLANIRKLLKIIRTDKLNSVFSELDILEFYRLEIDLDKQIRGYKDKFGEKAFKKITLEEKARQSDSMKIYTSAYWLLSQDIHLTARGLDRFMSEKEGHYQIINDLELERFHNNLDSFYIIFSAFLSECNKYFGFPTDEELKILQLQK